MGGEHPAMLYIPCIKKNIITNHRVLKKSWPDVFYAVCDHCRNASQMCDVYYVSFILCDGSQPATGCDLLSNDPNLKHSELRWAGRSPSGFAVRNISPSGNMFEFDLDVPW